MDYSLIVQPAINGVAEKQKSYLSLSERHIQAIWLEQKYFKKLTTSEGHEVKILSPGIWNSDSGPDFLKAHLQIDGKEEHGDIELHLRAESWYQHRHHENERYNNVIFHLSFWSAAMPPPIKNSAGKVIQQAFLEPFLTIPPAKIVRLIDLDLYPYKKYIGAGRCAHALFKQLPDHEIITLFSQAAQWRLKQKQHHLNSMSDDDDEAFKLGMIQGLGYKNNSAAMLTLYNSLLPYNHLPEEELLVLAMNLCGFFSRHYQKLWRHSDYYNKLISMCRPITPLEKGNITLTLSHIRPQHHPLRRLVYLIKLMKSQIPLYSRLKKQWTVAGGIIRIGKHPKQAWEQLLQALPTFDDEYWCKHYLFEVKESDKSLTLLGDSLKQEILINSFMPLLHRDLQLSSPLELDAFQKLYSWLPSSGNSKSKYLIHRFFGDSIKGSLLSRCLTEQGAFQLHHDFCSHFEASCRGCPFVERFLAVRGCSKTSNAHI